VTDEENCEAKRASRRVLTGMAEVKDVRVAADMKWEKGR
jgi:hypothetical protein